MKFREEKNRRKSFSEFSIYILLIFFREMIKSYQITHNNKTQHAYQEYTNNNKVLYTMKCLQLNMNMDKNGKNIHAHK